MKTQRIDAVNQRQGQGYGRSWLGSEGFTFIENLVLLLIFGILMAIAAPSWFAFSNRTRLNTAQDFAYQIIRQAQEISKHQNVVWQASFREVDGILQGAAHPADAPVHQIRWQSFDDAVKIDPAKSTLAHPNNVYRVQFNPKGHVNGQLGRLTFQINDETKVRRCVIVSTLLGVVRKQREDSNADHACTP